MSKVRVIYGSTTGTTEAVARRIAAAFGTEAIGIAQAGEADFEGELVILGTSTWGFGELQDDWISGVEFLDRIDLTGKKIALFGTGDQVGFSETFCDAVGILAGKVRERGGVPVGFTSSAGYSHNASLAEEDGRFCGLLLDENNEPDKSEERIVSWIRSLEQILKG